MQTLYLPLNVISRLLLSKRAGPKVIIISGFHCTCQCEISSFRRGADCSSLFGVVTKGIWYMFTVVSGQPISPIFKGQAIFYHFI